MELLHSLMDFVLHIDKHLSDIIRDYQGWTYLILFIIIFAETGFVVTPFLPGDSLLFAAGALIAQGNTGLSIHWLNIILIIAAFSGNTLNYWLGTYLGPKVFKEKNKVLKLSYYLQTKDFFDKHGGKSVIFSRFVPIIRTIAPFVAGVGRMPFGRYSFYNIIGGASWIAIFLYGGFLFGNTPFFRDHFSIIAIAIVVISLGPPIFIFLKSKIEKAKSKNN